MGYYHTAQICLNGHMINSSYDTCGESNELYCSRCGSKTITVCPSCNASLRGKYECGVTVVGFRSHVDSYCYNCGNPYPWTKSALEATALAIKEEETISESQKNSLVESLPDIISETPKTNLAVIRVKKCISATGHFTTDAIRQFVIDFGCELAKKSLGL